MCEMCTFSKEETGGRWGLGLAWEGKSGTTSLQTTSASRTWFIRSLFPITEAGHLEREGGSCWIPLKAREGGPSAWGYPLDIDIARKPNVYVHLLLKHIGWTLQGAKSVCLS